MQWFIQDVDVVVVVVVVVVVGGGGGGGGGGAVVVRSTGWLECSRFRAAGPDVILTVLYIHVSIVVFEIIYIL